MAITDTVDQLRADFSGEVLLPGEAGYEETRKVHNGLIDKRPGVIARCRVTADVRDAVNAARAAGLEISVRGGGHNVAGLAVTEGGMMIDLSLMKGIHVDPERRTVRAQPGVIWREYNRATAAYGLATTGGVISTTGIAGLTLGGGLGWLMGKHGMAIDNLVSAEVVLASGEVVTASEAANEDLFWAIRGGGGNFGVVTSFEYRAHPLTTVVGGLAAHPLAAAPEVLGFMRDFNKGVRDELTLFGALAHAPDGSGMKISALAVCHAGDDVAEAEADVRPLKEYGPPVLDVIDRLPYPVMNTLLDDTAPRGALNYWKSAFFADLTDDAIRLLLKAAEDMPTIMCGLFIEHFHGAVTRVAPTATAFPHRAPGYNLVITSEWLDPSDGDACIAWTRDTFKSLKPYFADRAYVNYLAADEGGRVQHAYGPNYTRLVELKRRYDPENLFRLNQNIDPR